MNEKTMGADTPRRFVGNLSPLSMLRGVISTEPDVVPEVEVEKLDLNKADDLKKAVAVLLDANKRLTEREKSGRVVTEDEWKKLDDGLRDLSTKMKATEETLRAGSEFLKGGEQFLLEKASLRLDAPDGMAKAQRTYFNVVALSFEELAGLSHASRAQRAAIGLSDDVSRLYSSPGASRLREAQSRMQFLNDVLLVKDVLLAPAANMGERVDLNARLARMQGYREWKEYDKAVGEFSRAFNEGSATAGLNWVPTVLSAQMMDLVQVELRIAGLFPQVTMTSKTLDWPVLGSDLVAYLVAEATGDGTDAAPTASQALTNKITFTAQKLMVRSFASSEIIEDSIVGMVQFILGNAAKVLARGIEDALVNGEDGVTLDGAVFNPAGGVRRAWKGLRFYALAATNPAKVDMGSAAPTVAKLMDVQLGMGVYGANPKALAWITGFRGLKRLMGMTELVTMDKLGSAATILTGQVGSLFGSPVILSEFVFDQKTTGAYGDGTARTFGSILCVYRDAFGLATRRAIGINASSDRYIEQDQTVFVGSLRSDFKPFYTPSATVAPVGVLYNIT